MSKIFFRHLLLIFFCATVSHAGIPTGPPPEPATYGVHFFDCIECHGPFMSLTEDVADVFCLRCHKVGANPVSPPPKGWPPITREDGITPWHDGESGIHFSGDDASNAFGNNPGASLQTSHNWAVGTDRIPAAGASPPLDPGFYSNYGTSLDKITCSRCHLPHEDTENPKLLAMGPDSADAMCLDCHRAWNQSNNHGWLTHPLVADYNAAVAAEPDKYKPNLDNKDRAGIQKVNGGISCTSCHGIHFVDSNASTPDSPYNIAELNPSSGHLLRGDGPATSDKSSLCQTCHTYAEHGDDTGEKVGCLRCHGGHAYDPGSPNYFVLRKSTNTASFGIVANLDYSSPDVLNNSLTYTFWNDQVDGSADGYCEKCHGDAKAIGVGAGDYHVTNAICTDCHEHSNMLEGSFSAACDTCHAFPPVWGNHRLHLDSGRFDKRTTCDTCHETSVHLNDLSEVRFDSADNRVDTAAYSGTAPSRYTVATGYNTTTPAYGQCDNLYCHSNVQGQVEPTQAPDYQTPSWGGTIVTRCKACHNGGAHPGLNPVADPPMDTGSHTKHLDYIFGNTTTIMSCQACHWLGETNTCEPCHFNHVNYGDSTYNRLVKHVNGSIDVDFQPIAAGASAMYSGDSIPQTSYGSCSTTYCHSLGEHNVSPGQLPAAYSGDLYRNPAWGGSSLSCNGCHGLSTANGMPDYISGAAGTETSNSHAAHVIDSQISCYRCHFGTTEDGTTISYDGLYRKHANGVNTDVEFNTAGLNPIATYNSPVTMKTCKTTYCHGGYPGSGLAVTPTWGDTSAGACGSCHGGDNDTPPNSGSHVKHTETTGFNLSCTACHSSIIAGTGTYTVTDLDKHINGKIDWAFDTTDTRLQGGSETYNVATGTAPPSDGVIPRSYGTCDNIYCHSTGQGVTDPTQPPTYNSPTWGEAVSGQCGSCHDLGSHADSNDIKVISSGSHQKHLKTEYSFSGSGSNCQVCHYDSEIFNFGCGFCHDNDNWPDNGPRKTPKHVDGSVDVAFRTQIAGTDASYSGDSIPGTAYGSCSDTYCHAGGTSVATSVVPPNTTPIWGQTLGCDGCHGNPPAYTDGLPKENTHVEHAAYSCDNCHLHTTTDGTTITDIYRHVNEEYDLYPGQGKYFTYTYSGDGGTCSSIACHGYTDAEWGDSTTYSCIDLDADGICADDNCPTMANPGQEDDDGDGIGNVCDSWVSVGAGDSSGYALKSNDTWWSWGAGGWGNLGDGTGESNSLPIQSGPDTDWAFLDGGALHAMALKNNGTLWAIGYNYYGQLGRGNTSNASSPVQIGSDSNWMTVDAGDYHTLAIKTDGTLWAWGRNHRYQLGDGTLTNRTAPVQIGTDTDWEVVSAGGEHSLAIKTNGTLWAWGQNSSNQLGDGTNVWKSSPVQIGAATNWMSVAAGSWHSIALQDDGKLWVWGDNLNGQLGLGNTGDKIIPTRASSTIVWTSISAGRSHNLAVKNDGTLWSWGTNNDGQLGNGTTTLSKFRVKVGTDSDWKTVAAGTNHSIAAKTNGTVWAWGRNSSGQVGDGTKTGRLIPVQID